MKKLTLLLVALVAAIVGGTIIYLLVAVPRDLKADRLVREAHDAVKQKKDGEAREKLREVVQKYPRTEAGASASAALFEIGEQERQAMRKELAALAAQNADLARRLAALEAGAKAPPPQVDKPEPKKEPVVRKAPAKKRAARRMTRRRRRR